MAPISTASSFTMRQLFQSIAQETIGQTVRSCVSRPAMFAVHVHRAKRAAVRVAKDHHGAARGTGRNDGDLSIRRWVDFKTGWKLHMHPAQDAVGIGQGKLRWEGIAFVQAFVRRCAKVVQRFLQILRNQCVPRQISVPVAARACPSS